MKSKRSSFRSGGFSLAEVMVAVAIMGVMSLMITRMFETQQSAVKITESKFEEQNFINRVQLLLTDDVACNNTFVGYAPNSTNTTQGEGVKNANDDVVYSIETTSQPRAGYSLGQIRMPNWYLTEIEFDATQTAGTLNDAGDEDLVDIIFTLRRRPKADGSPYVGSQQRKITISGRFYFIGDVVSECRGLVNDTVAANLSCDRLGGTVTTVGGIPRCELNCGLTAGGGEFTAFGPDTTFNAVSTRCMIDALDQTAGDLSERFVNEGGDTLTGNLEVNGADININSGSNLNLNAGSSLNFNDGADIALTGTGGGDTSVLSLNNDSRIELNSGSSMEVDTQILMQNGSRLRLNSGSVLTIPLGGSIQIDEETPGSWPIPLGGGQPRICIGTACRTSFRGSACAPNQVVTQVEASGWVQCKTVSCASGKYFQGFDGLGDPICVNLQIIGQTCGAGEFVSQINPDGSVVCLPLPTGTGVSCPNGAAEYMYEISDANVAICNDFQDKFVEIHQTFDKHVYGRQCTTEGEYLIGYDEFGTPICDTPATPPVYYQCPPRIEMVCRNGAVGPWQTCQVSVAQLTDHTDPGYLCAGQVFEGSPASCLAVNWSNPNVQNLCANCANAGSVDAAYVTCNAIFDPSL